VATIELTWIEQKRFLGVDSGRHSVVLSSGDDVGVRPSENLLIALAGCAAYDIVEILQKQRLALRSLKISAAGEQAAAAPWAYTAIHLRVAAAAPGLRPEQLARAADLAINKYCSVRASLHPDIAVTFDVLVED
jgi:putative redox protein